MPTSEPLTEPSTTSSSAEPKLSYIEPADVTRVWPVVRKLVESALPRAMGRLSIDDCELGCIRGNFGLWIVTLGDKVAGVGLSEVLHFPRKRVFSVFLYAGERRRVMSLWPTIEDVARAVDCHEVQIAGPRAWQRIFPDYQEAFTVFTKAIR